METGNLSGIPAGFSRLAKDRLQPFAENIRPGYADSQLVYSPSHRSCLRRTIISSHVYHEIFLHFNWHTKDDSPILVPAVEQVVHNLLADRCQKSQGVFLHGIGGTQTHVHLAISIEPQVTISDMVKDLKGGSSHDTNQALGAATLGWQRGYGVVSFGKRNLPWVLEYIAHQKERHARSKVVDRLERADVDD